MTGPLPGTVLAARDLWFSYADRWILRGLTADFGRGLTWVRGPNGCGKSTLIKLLAGVLEPSSGTRCVHGIDAARRPLDYRRQVFWCGPGSLPLGHLRAAEYFGFLQGLYPGFDASALAVHLHGFGLEDALSQPVADLSTGTQRKLWLTAALAVGTAAVLLDEPLNALDERSLAYARSALTACDQRARQTWIVASHADPCDGWTVSSVLELG